jgi:hypothetical protein
VLELFFLLSAFAAAALKSVPRRPPPGFFFASSLHLFSPPIPSPPLKHPFTNPHRVQNLQNFRWEEDDVNRRLDRKMTDAFAAIWRIHQDKRVPLRTAAFIKALQEVTRAEIHRGFD